MALTRNDIGLDSLAKALGEAIDNDIADSLFNRMNQSPQTHSAITNPTLYPAATSSGSIPITQFQHLIKGDCFKVTKTITLEMWQDLPHDVIKIDMVKLLVQELMKNNYIEFTSQVEAHAPNQVELRARIFVTPDDQVRILRVNGVI